VIKKKIDQRVETVVQADLRYETCLQMSVVNG